MGAAGDSQLLQRPPQVGVVSAEGASGSSRRDRRVSAGAGGEPGAGGTVQALPEKYRRAIYLRYYEEYAVEEIAVLMGCSPGQVSTYLYRGKAKLKTMLGGSYGTECLSE